MNRCYRIHLNLILNTFAIFTQFSFKCLLYGLIITFTCHDVILAETFSESTSNSDKVVSTSVVESNEGLESKFHVKIDTIIRTQESRSSGAKYLNDTSVASNRDCMILCWETHGCNVAVFQQKAKGSCYLFDCGSPSSFHCKFTRHSSYISSILKVTQHSYDLNQWGNEVKHEKELAKLRSNTVVVANSTVAVSSFPVTTVETKPTTHLLTLQKESVNTSVKENKCHHYQFQCINDSECIAIYNVCDGIPQCIDGSDESEIHCPTQGNDNTLQKLITSTPHIVTEPTFKVHVKASAPTITIHPTSNIHAKTPEQVEKQNFKETPKEEAVVKSDDFDIPWPDRYIDNEDSEKNYKYHASGSDTLGGPFLHKHSQFVAANDPHVQSLNRWSSDYDEYPQHSGSIDQQYNTYESSYPRPDEQYSPNQFVPDFKNGKQYNNYRQEDVPYWPSQGSLQDPTDEYLQPGLRILNKSPSYHEEAYAPEQMSRSGDQFSVPSHHVHHKYMDNMPGSQQGRMPNSPRQPKQRLQPYSPYDESQHKAYPDYPEVRHYEMPQHVESNQHAKEEVIKENIVNKLLPNGNHLKYSAENRPKTSMTDRNSDKSLQLKKKVIAANDAIPQKAPISEVKPQTVLDFKMSVTELFQSSRTHTHETNSAILALILGLVITGLLVVLSICRLKTIRRRLSRKGRSLAHDADYLVNGMYL